MSLTGFLVVDFQFLYLVHPVTRRHIEFVKEYAILGSDGLSIGGKVELQNNNPKKYYKGYVYNGLRPGGGIKFGKFKRNLSALLQKYILPDGQKFLIYVHGSNKEQKINEILGFLQLSQHFQVDNIELHYPPLNSGDKNVNHISCTYANTAHQKSCSIRHAQEIRDRLCLSTITTV